MNELEFLRGIEGEEQSGTDLVSGAEHLVRLKIQAGQQAETRYPDLELEKQAQPDWNQAMLTATTGLGAVAGGVGTYLSSRPQKETGKSKTEENLEASVKANKERPTGGFLQKLKNQEVESAHGISKVFREHPAKASLLGALMGGSFGYGIGQLGGAIARRGGK